MIRTTEYGPVTRYDLAKNMPAGWRYWTTAYQVGSLLIDSGCAHCADELVQVLSARQGLTHIVNTHTHEDHIGANGRLQKLYHLTIMAHPLALPVLQDPRGQQPLKPYRRIFWGMPEPSQGIPLENQATITCEGHTYQVIYTPGHSPDHICLYEPDEGWLFSGDLFVGGKERALREGYDIWGIIDSLKKISRLKINWLFPGSARARKNPEAEIHAKIDYLQRLAEGIVQSARDGLSEARIARKILGPPMRVELITLGHFSRRHLVRSCLGKYRMQ